MAAGGSGPERVLPGASGGKHAKSLINCDDSTASTAYMIPASGGPRGLPPYTPPEAATGATPLPTTSGTFDPTFSGRCNKGVVLEAFQTHASAGWSECIYHPRILATHQG
jgi:hypothetical protein